MAALTTGSQRFCVSYGGQKIPCHFSVEYRAPFVPAILPGSTHMCCIAMELGVATPITIYHTATSFSVDWLHAYNI